MARIFINYRRDDAPGVAGRLFDYLALKYSRRELFMDVDAMQPGLDFAKQLDVQVAQCHVLLAVIGPHWLDVHDQSGKRRLDADNDYVRLEIASALKRDIAVIPVLVDGAAMPPEDKLSDDLKPLARRHALELRHTRFNADAEAIMHALEAMVPRSRMPLMLAGAGVAIAIAAAVGFVVIKPKLTAKPAGPSPVVALQPAPPGPVPPPATAPPAPVSPAASSPAVSPSLPSAPAPPKQEAAVTPAQPDAPAVSVSSLLGSAMPPGLSADLKIGEMMSGVAFRGSIMRVTDIAADPAVCQAACRAEPRCAVWTYTQPGPPNQMAHCSLKAVIPAPQTDACCTSAIERAPPPELRQPPPIPPGLTGAIAGIELEGGTYRYFGGTEATPDGCQAACRADGQCLAWDYVRPGIFSADARCFLKNRNPIQVSSPCCIAGFERQTAAAPGGAAPGPPATTSAEPMFKTNLFGSDYRGVELAADDWAQCQKLCKAETQCLAWTVVRPGIQGPKARCWLKNKIPQPKADGCCTSGIERAEAK